MALPSSGTISLLDISGEFGGDVPHALTEYYDADTGVPASGTIDFADFHGADAGPQLEHFATSSSGGNNTGSYGNSPNLTVTLPSTTANRTIYAVITSNYLSTGINHFMARSSTDFTGLSTFVTSRKNVSTGTSYEFDSTIVEVHDAAGKTGTYNFAPVGKWDFGVQIYWFAYYGTLSRGVGSSQIASYSGTGTTVSQTSGWSSTAWNQDLYSSAPGAREILFFFSCRGTGGGVYSYFTVPTEGTYMTRNTGNFDGSSDGWGGGWLTMKTHSTYPAAATHVRLDMSSTGDHLVCHKVMLT